MSGGSLDGPQSVLEASWDGFRSVWRPPGWPLKCLAASWMAPEVSIVLLDGPRISPLDIYVSNQRFRS